MNKIQYFLDDRMGLGRIAEGQEQLYDPKIGDYRLARLNEIIVDPALISAAEADRQRAKCDRDLGHMRGK